MKINVPNKIRVEDFSDEFKEIAEKLSGINSFYEDITNLVNNKRIDYDNLNRQKAQFDVTTDASGVPINFPQIKLSLNSKPHGINIVRIDNLLDPGVYPNYLPFIAFTFNDVILSITKINGLTANAKYRLYIEIIGS